MFSFILQFVNSHILCSSFLFLQNNEIQQGYYQTAEGSIDKTVDVNVPEEMSFNQGILRSYI